MSKIIAFPQDRTCLRQARARGRARVGGRGLSTGRALPSTKKEHAASTGTVTPIWASGGHGILASVVIPTCNRARLLNRCLAALVNQTLDSSRFEIIVVDDVPQAETREVVARWAHQSAVTGPRIYYLPSDGPHGPPAARNRGWHAARGALVAFTDDGAIPQRDWLANGIFAFDGIVQAAWGRIVTPLAGVPTEYERSAKNMEQAEFLTANCFCQRHLLEELEGFDERFSYGWRDDADLYFRMLQADVAVAHAPGAVVERPVEPPAWGESIRQQRKIMFDALLYKKHPSLYREKISNAVRWDYYATVACFVLLLEALLASGRGALPAAAGGWLMLTMRFFLHRIRDTDKSAAHVFEMLATSLVIPPVAIFWRLVGAIRFRVRFI